MDRNWDLFQDVESITEWLDSSNPASEHEDSMRVLKLLEEAGEAAAAYIGMVGQNPRKGVTHTKEQLLDELADVAVTALCAIQHFTQDTYITRELFTGKLRRIVDRKNMYKWKGDQNV
jgi:NTP pyrophosphatase (non-canonical NTP hydrolase)